MDYKNILLNNGFVKFKTCHCSGTYEEHYRKLQASKLQFIVKPFIKTLKTKINGRVVCITDLINLQSEIDKYI